VYAATKFGVIASPSHCAQEVTARGVRVALIEPGCVATELTGHITDPSMWAFAKQLMDSIGPLQPEDVANAVLYAITQPDHVAVNGILIRPTDQTV
jgi:NADP-dependent 3-hydroxy acid dehydrogenase YdfG